MVQSGNSITVTLGTLSGGTVRTDNKTVPMVLTPSTLDRAGNACSSATATESGALDLNL